MKFAPLAMAIAATFVVSTASTAVWAGADDAKWISQCIADNADAKVGAEVVTTYCACMNSKMSDSETQSITQWEKSHPDERMACEKAAGWK